MACAAPNSGTGALPSTSGAPNDQITAGNATTGASNQASSVRGNRFAMDGVGARVIRGPDWKWGKQVSKNYMNKVG